MDEIGQYFNDLLDKEESIRYKAAKYFSWMARKEYNNSSKNIFENIITYEKLYPLLHDNNIKIICEIIAALGCANERYRKDEKLETELIKLFNSSDKDILYMASVWTRSINRDEKYKHVINLLEQSKSRKTIKALCEHFVKNIEYDMKNKLKNILLKKLDAIKNNDTKKIIIRELIGTIYGEKRIKYASIHSNDFIENIKEKMEIYFNETEKEKIMKIINIK